MKILKNKFKIILAFILILVLVSGFSVYSTYNYLAKDIIYEENI